MPRAKQIQTVVTEMDERPAIDPKQVPDYAYDIACTILFSSISRALADPKLKAEYEAWKRSRSA